jgi:hypothetical protein
MAKIVGSNCGVALFAVQLPFAAVVHALTVELGLTREEAIRAAIDAQRRCAAGDRV